MDFHKLYQVKLAALLGCFFLVLPLVAQKKENADPEVKRRNIEFLLTEGMRYQINGDFAKALNEYIKAKEIDDQNATINFKISQVYAHDEKLDKALLHITTATKSDPSNKFYYVFKANIETMKGDFASAINSYEDMRVNTTETEEYLLELAALYMYSGNLKKALATYEEAENHYGIFEQIVFQKQSILLKMNKLKEAIAEGQKLIDAYPGDAEYVEAQATILMSNGKTKEAIAMITAFLENFEANPPLQFLLAKTYRNQGNMEMASPYLIASFGSKQIDISEKTDLISRMINTYSIEGSIDLIGDLCDILELTHPEEALVYAISGDFYYATDRKEKALKKYMLSLEQDKDNFQLWQNILSIQMDYQRYESLIEISEEAIEYFPNQPVLFLFNGTANLIKKNYTEAIYALEQGLKLSSSNLGMKNTFKAQLGDAYNGKKQYQKSAEYYEAALEYEPDNAHVLNNYSYFLSVRKTDLDKAKKMSTRLIKNNPDNPTYLDTHAWVLYNLGEYQEARKHLEKAVKKSDSCTIFEHYGDVLFRLGQVDEAVTQWKRGLEKGGCDEQLSIKIKEQRLYE